MIRNVCKIGVWAWLALLLCVFLGCKESKIAQSHLPIPKECESLFPKQEINFDFHKDSAAFMECYIKHNGKKNIICDESEFNEYSVCAVIHPKKFGFPRECLDFVEQEDSLSYYACCKKHNGCWVVFYDYENSKEIPEQLDYSYVNPEKMKSIEDYNNPTIEIRPTTRETLNALRERVKILEDRKNDKH